MENLEELWDLSSKIHAVSKFPSDDYWTLAQVSGLTPREIEESPDEPINLDQLEFLANYREAVQSHVKSYCTTLDLGEQVKVYWNSLVMPRSHFSH